MAVANPSIDTDTTFGEQYTFWTDGVEIYFTSYIDGDKARIAAGKPPLGRATPVYAFDQVEADSPIGVTILQPGRIVVTYLDTDGSRLEKVSDQDGDAGTWVTPS